MKTEGLTAKQVEHMKPAAERQEVPAGPPAGLYLVLQPGGAKSWALRYRWHGKTRKLTLGPYSKAFGLAAARGDAEAKLKDLRDGRDPAEVHAEEKTQQQPDSVEAVAEEWLNRHVR